jgi:hypothetical protein
LPGVEPQPDHPKVYALIASPVGGALFRSTLINHEDAKDAKVAHGESRACNAQAEAQSSKSFWFFFSKKNRKKAKTFSMYDL